MERFKETCTTSSSASDNFQLVKSCFVTIRKKLEKSGFTMEGIMHKKIRNKVAYMDYGSTEEIPEDACSLRKHGDLTTLN